MLRYGWFYGPGTNYDPAGSIPRSLRKRPGADRRRGRRNLLVHPPRRRRREPPCRRSRVREPGIYNIVDDEPARLSEWLPFVAALLRAPAPVRDRRERGPPVARRHAGLHPERTAWRVEREGAGASSTGRRASPRGGKDSGRSMKAPSHSGEESSDVPQHQDALQLRTARDATTRSAPPRCSSCASSAASTSRRRRTSRRSSARSSETAEVRARCCDSLVTTASPRDRDVEAARARARAASRFAGLKRQPEISIPPSTGSTTPVTRSLPQISDTIAADTSSGSATRPSGDFASIAFLIGS